MCDLVDEATRHCKPIVSDLTPTPTIRQRSDCS